MGHMQWSTHHLKRVTSVVVFLSSFKNRKLQRGKPAASNAADTFVWQTAEVCQELLGFLSGIFASGGANAAGNTYFNLKK